MAQLQFAFSFGELRLLRDRPPLGAGAYGKVYRATLGELPCAAKLLHPVLVDPSNPRNWASFERECRFLSEIRHPNIVQYLGVDLVEEGGSSLRVLLMELMDDSLTNFLKQSEDSLPYTLQVNISHDIALALAFLHANRIVHRDLSSNNVLLIGPGIRAKVTDFGMSKLLEMNLGMSGLTSCPGTPQYMSPEALSEPPLYTEKLDCFQAGVLMIQTITRKFPNPSDATHRVRDGRSPTGWVNIPVPEVERRQSHLSLVPCTHPMLVIALECLKDKDTERPSAQHICHRLLALKESSQYGQSIEARGGERDGEVQEREQLMQQLRQENEERQREVGERERETRRLQNYVKQVKEEVHMREKTIESLRSELQLKDTEIHRREEEISEHKAEIKRLLKVIDYQDHSLQKQPPASAISPLPVLERRFSQLASFTCEVGGPGLLSATACQPAHVVVELTHSNGRQCSVQQNITAEFISTSPLSPTSSSRWRWPKKANAAQTLPTNASTVVVSPSRYEVSYTAAVRGQYKLYLRVNGREIDGSPFLVTVHPSPNQLSAPTRIVDGVNGPYGIAFNSCKEIIITECWNHRVCMFDTGGRWLRAFGSCGDKDEHMIEPAGIATDTQDNNYVSSKHKVQKFTSTGELVKCVGSCVEGSGEDNFKDPRGIAVFRDQVYVCDSGNHRIKVLGVDLNFVQTIGSHGKEEGQFDVPLDVKFGAPGSGASTCMYVADFGNRRIQVIDISGQFMQVFSQDHSSLSISPTALNIADNYMYISSDWTQNQIVVCETSGQFVTSLGPCGQAKGLFAGPYSIASCSLGCVHVCDMIGNKVCFLNHCLAMMLW